MMNKLDQLKKMTKVVADTGSFDEIGQYQPIDSTTNPSLLLNAIQMEQYSYLIEKNIYNNKHLSSNNLIKETMLDISVDFGLEILKLIPGRVSTEVDARLSFDITNTIKCAERIIDKYLKKGIDKSRILIKIAATWEGIQAAKLLEQKGINCNLTLIFNIVQAISCAQAKVYLISPFVGRITDWYMKNDNTTDFPHIKNDMGILSVKEIYQYYKQYHYPTIVMGASFRHVKQIEALAGCDALTIAPHLLKELQNDNNILDKQLFHDANNIDNNKDTQINEEKFRWLMNENKMSTEKLAEGIRNFTTDTLKLEKIIKNNLK